MSGAEGDTKQPWTFSFRYIADQIPRASVRMTLTYRIHPRFSAGIEGNPRAGKASPLANLLVVPETLRRPALIVGTSSDRIGTPGGQAYYALFSKNLRRETKLPIAPYVGAAYGTFEDRWRPVAGVNVGFTEHFTTLVTFDGVHVHQLVNYAWRQHVFSFVLVRSRDPGFSYSITF